MSSNQIGFYNTKSTLFVSNIDPNVTERELKKLFSFFGPIHPVKFIQIYHASESTKYAYIKFFDAKHATSAKEKAQYYLLGQKNIRISFKRDEKDFLFERILFIENLPNGCTHHILRLHFHGLGAPASDIRIDQSREGRAFGRGYVTFATGYDAKNALKRVRGKKLEGRELKVTHFGSSEIDDINTSINIKIVFQEKSNEEIKTFLTEVLSEYGNLRKRPIINKRVGQLYEVIAVFNEQEDAEGAVCDLRRHPDKFSVLDYTIFVQNVDWYQEKNDALLESPPKVQNEGNKQNPLVGKVERAYSQVVDNSTEGILRVGISELRQNEKLVIVPERKESEKGDYSIEECKEEELKDNENKDLNQESSNSDASLKLSESDHNSSKESQTISSITISSRTHNSIYGHSNLLSISALTIHSGLGLVTGVIESSLCKSHGEKEESQYQADVQKTITKLLAKGDHIENMVLQKQSDSNNCLVAIRYTEVENNPFERDFSKPIRFETEDGKEYLINLITKETYNRLRNEKVGRKEPGQLIGSIISGSTENKKDDPKAKISKPKKNKKHIRRQRKKRKQSKTEFRLIYQTKGDKKQVVLDRSMHAFERFNKIKKKIILKQSLLGSVRKAVGSKLSSQVLDMLIDSIKSKPEEIKKFMRNEKYREDKCREMVNIIKEKMNSLVPIKKSQESNNKKQKQQEILWVVKKSIFEKKIGIEFSKFLRFDVFSRNQTLEDFLLPRVSSLTNNHIAPKIVNMLIGMSGNAINQLRSIVEDNDYLKNTVQRLFKYLESRKHKEPKALIFRPKRPKNRTRNAWKRQINSLNDGSGFVNLYIANFFMYCQMVMSYGFYPYYDSYPAYQNMAEYQYVSPEIIEPVAVVNPETHEETPVVEEQPVEDKVEKELLKVPIIEERKENRANPSSKKQKPYRDKKLVKENREDKKINSVPQKEELLEDRERKNCNIKTPIKEDHKEEKVSKPFKKKGYFEDPNRKNLKVKTQIKEDCKEGDTGLPFKKQEEPSDNKAIQEAKTKKRSRKNRHKENKGDKINICFDKEEAVENRDIKYFKKKNLTKQNFQEGRVNFYFVKKESLEDKEIKHNVKIKTQTKEDCKEDKANLPIFNQESVEARAITHFKKNLATLNGYNLDKRAEILGIPLLPKIVAITDKSLGLKVFAELKAKGVLKSVENVMDLLDNQDLLKRQVEAIIKKLES